MSNQQKLALAAMVLKYGANDEYALPVARTPDNVRFGLMQRTFSHIMGNEADAVRVRLTNATNDDGTAKYTAEEVAVMVHDWRVAKIATLESGEFSLRQVGPKMSSDEKNRRMIARDLLVKEFTEKKQPMPKASDTETWDSYIDDMLEIPELAAAVEAEVQKRKAFKIPEIDLSLIVGKTKAA